MFAGVGALVGGMYGGYRMALRHAALSYGAMHPELALKQATIARRLLAYEGTASVVGGAVGYMSSPDDATGLQRLQNTLTGANIGNMLAGFSTAIPAIRRALFNACFAAGTPIRTPDGHKNVEDIKLGDLVLSRDENSPDGIIAAQTVEELFVREAILWNLTVGGRLIQTTGEHPFFVQDKGWTNAQELAIGDRLLTEDGTWAEVQSLENTETLSIVYNFRVSDYHTYFVGTAAWGFAVWAHNACKGVDAASDVPRHLYRKQLGDTHFDDYQRHVTGRAYEHYFDVSGKPTGVDGIRAKFTVEAKWAGKNNAAFRKSVYNPQNPRYHELDKEADILGQARRLIALNNSLNLRGVRYAVSNAHAANHFQNLFMKHFPEETTSGLLKVFHVPGNGM